MQKKYYLPLALVFQIVLIQLISFFPVLIEDYYSNELYIYISNFLRIILGFFPFSLGDFGYLLAIVFLIIGYIKNRKINNLSWKDRILKIFS